MAKRTLDALKMEVPVKKDWLMDGEWVSIQHVSHHLIAKEKSGMADKYLRTRFHNNTALGKYNIVEKYGIRVINAHYPMAEGVADTSLDLSVKVED